MRAVGSHRRARTICLALVAGLAAFEAVLLLSAGAVGIPGVVLVRVADDGNAPQSENAAEAPGDGGESVVAKPHVPSAVPEPPAETQAPPAGEPHLDGLADVPLRDWIAPKSKGPEPQTLAEAAKSGEALPWDAIEPVPFDSAAPKLASAGTTASLPSPVRSDRETSPALAELPANGAVESWVKAKATEMRGEHRTRPLYHFEFWLDAPDEVKRRLVAVAYQFNTPAVRPQSQISVEKASGFKVSAGGLVCADKVTVTLKFNDGRSQQVAVDGCKLLS
jgi:hypothetical protein